MIAGNFYIYMWFVSQVLGDFIPNVVTPSTRPPKRWDPIGWGWVIRGATPLQKALRETRGALVSFHKSELFQKISHSALILPCELLFSHMLLPWNLPWCGKAKRILARLSGTPFILCFLLQNSELQAMCFFRYNLISGISLHPGKIS